MNKVKKHRGMTLAETCMALMLMSFVMLLAVNLLGLILRAGWGVDQQIRDVRQDSAFLARFNQEAQESTIAFTIPKNSFTKDKLDVGWDYLGLMDDVPIPASESRTGRAITAQALVYVSYKGATAPSDYNSSDTSHWIHNSKGYFYREIFGHAYTDPDGLRHSYCLSLEHKEADLDPSTVTTAAKSVTYQFKSALTDASGNNVGDGTDVDIKTVVNSINAAQIVTLGNPDDADNPAVALAFRSDYMPTGQEQLMTVALVVDASIDMSPSIGSYESRLKAAKEAMVDLVNKLAECGGVQVVFVPYSTYALHESNFSDVTICEKLRDAYRNRRAFNLDDETQKNELLDAIQGLDIPQGRVNGQDGARVAYWYLKGFAGPKAVVLITSSWADALTAQWTKGSWNRFRGRYDSTSHVYDREGLVCDLPYDKNYEISGDIDESRDSWIIIQRYRSGDSYRGYEQAMRMETRLLLSDCTFSVMVALNKETTIRDSDVVGSLKDDFTHYFQADTVSGMSSAFDGVVDKMQQGLRMLQGPRI